MIFKGILITRGEAPMTTDKESGGLGGAGERALAKQSSARMSSLASEFLNRTDPDDGDIDPDDLSAEDIEWLIASGRSLAASVLVQDQTPGQ
jgi:hypothetical protein